MTADYTVVYLLLLSGLLWVWMPLYDCCEARSPSSRPGNLRKRELDIHEELLQLIENYTFVMDLEFDGELMSGISSDLSSALESYLRMTRWEERDHSIVHQALLGAFRLRGNTIKDRLAAGKLLTVSRAEFGGTAEWWLVLLKMIVRFSEFDLNGVGGDKTTNVSPLELAVKLQMTEAASLLLEHGARLCSSFVSLECTDALQYAVINQDIHLISLLVEAFRKEQLKYSLQTSGGLCWLWTSKGREISFSSLEIAQTHCQVGLSCTALEYIHSLLGSTLNCSFAEDRTPWWNSEINPLKENNPRICPANTVSEANTFAEGSKHLQGDSSVFGHWLPQWAAVDSGTRSWGWAVYKGWHLGKSGCDLPRININQLSVEMFKRLFVDLSIPVVIEGTTTGWALFEEWQRQRLREEYGSIDVLVGSIPYGEVFGERFGYASIQEFLSYMDRYILDPAPEVQWRGKVDDKEEGEDREEREGRETGGGIFSPPLYVFDSQVLEQNFSRFYSMPRSGAPFHFHCHAANALVFGRKKWFLLPPGTAVYSKQHPLLWYREQYHQVDEKPIECIQRSGELLYIPSGWSHSTVNLDECIGLAVEFESKDC